VLRCCWRQEEPLLRRFPSINAYVLARRQHGPNGEHQPCTSLSPGVWSVSGIWSATSFGAMPCRPFSSACREHSSEAVLCSVLVRCAPAVLAGMKAPTVDATTRRQNLSLHHSASSLSSPGFVRAMVNFATDFSQFRQQFARLSGRLASIDKTPEDVLLLENRQFGFGKREEIEDRLIVGTHYPGTPTTEDCSLAERRSIGLDERKHQRAARRLPRNRSRSRRNRQSFLRSN
jgi:hypothetical protein